MTTSYRVLSSAVLGLVLAGGLTVACATPHTIDGYISEIRGQMPDYDSRSTSDDQIVNIGRAMCSYPESFDTIGATENDATPEQQEQTDTFLATTKGYCDVLGTNPLPASVPGYGAPLGDTSYTDAAAPTAAPPAPPVPITIGKPIALNYGGTEDVSTTTINEVTRCGGEYLILDVTVKTGTVWSPNDSIAETIDYVDSSGVTRDATEYMAVGSTCGDYDDALPMDMDMKPGKTYQGLVQYEVPIGATKMLNLNGTDGVIRTLDVTGK